MGDRRVSNPGYEPGDCYNDYAPHSLKVESCGVIDEDYCTRLQASVDDGKLECT